MIQLTSAQYNALQADRMLLEFLMANPQYRLDAFRGSGTQMMYRVSSGIAVLTDWKTDPREALAAAMAACAPEVACVEG